MRPFRALALSTLLAAPALPAQTTSVYTDRADWLDVTSTSGSITFDGMAATANAKALTGTVSGMTFNPLAGGTLWVVDAAHSAPYNWGPGGVLAMPSFRGTFHAPVTSFGFDFGGLLSGGVMPSYTLTLSNGFTTTTTYAGSKPDMNFLGFTDMHGIAWFELVVKGASLGLIDDLSYGSYEPLQANEGVGEMQFALGQGELEQAVVVTPEPGSFALLAAGAAGLFLARRRRNRSRA